MLAISFGTSGRPGFYVEGAQFQSTQTLTLNAWSHVAATLSGTTATIYVNGIAAGTATFSTPPANVTRNLCYIGKSNWGGDPNALAVMDEIKIWNVARTPTQIQTDMNCDAPQHANLIAYYRFDQGTASGTNTGLTCAYDYSGNSRTGTLNQFCIVWQHI